MSGFHILYCVILLHYTMFGSFPNTYYNLHYITRKFSFQKVHLPLLPHHSYINLNTRIKSQLSLLIIVLTSKVSNQKKWHYQNMLFRWYLLCTNIHWYVFCTTKVIPLPVQSAWSRQTTCQHFFLFTSWDAKDKLFVSHRNNPSHWAQTAT